jgi:hypothetical protein
MRRAIQEVAQGIDLKDYETFNTRLLETIQRLQSLFNPASLAPPGSRSDSTKPHTPIDSANQLGLFPHKKKLDAPDASKTNPFEAFIEQLFPDDESDDLI